MADPSHIVRKGQGADNPGHFAHQARKPVAVAIPKDDTGTVQEPPLKDFRIVGYTRKVYKSPGDEQARPAGICYHCGAAIMNCILIENPKTRQIVDVGETCAERVGLNMAELRAMLRERAQVEQRELARKEREAKERTRAEIEAANTAEFGEHGTVSRWESGCRCDQCSTQAPHGTINRFLYGRCLCDPCIQATVDGSKYSIETITKLVDLTTGNILPARVVHTKYGPSWVVNDQDGNPTWYPYGPARRQTITKRGAVEVEVECIVKNYYSNGSMRYYEVAALSSSGKDRWGEDCPVAPESFGFVKPIEEGE